MTVAVVGIDGGSWNVLRRLVQEGYVPNLKKIINKGVRGNLCSTIPPITGAAWLSLATGLNPGKTGVIDFFKCSNKWTLEPVTSADFRGKSIWDFCSLYGLRVAVLDYPMLYPAYPVNGIMISTWWGELSTYPPGLVSLVKKVANGDYDIFVNFHLERYNDIELFLEDIWRSVDKKVKVSRYFIEKNWDLMVDVFSYTDWLQHRMWHYIDPNHPWYPGDNEALRYWKKFAELWQPLDEYIGEVITLYDHVFIVSDHGFGTQWGVFNLGKMVLESGYATVNKKIYKIILRFLLSSMIKIKLHTIVPTKITEKIWNRVNKMFSTLYFDTNSSKIIILNYTIPVGAIHVNPKWKNLQKELIEEFINVISKVTPNLKVQTWYSKDIYSGEKLGNLPELILTINDWACAIIKDPTKDFLYLDAPYSSRHTGSHRRFGIFLAFGKSIKEAKSINEVSILDITPTVLHIFGLPIPNSMDGNVLTTILTTSTEPRYVDLSHYVRLNLIRKVRKVREEIS